MEKEPFLPIAAYERWRAMIRETYQGNSQAEFAAKKQAIGLVLHKVTLRKVEQWPKSRKELVNFFVGEAPVEFAFWIRDTKGLIELGIEEDRRVKEICLLGARTLAERK